MTTTDDEDGAAKRPLLPADPPFASAGKRPPPDASRPPFSPLTYLLVSVFAMSPWVTIQGIWLEMPLLINELPERWLFPSYLVVIVQSGNVALLLYAAAKWRLATRLRESHVIYAILVTSASACVLLSLLWSETSWVAGAQRSVCLCMLIAVLACVDCVSAIVFLPYMMNLRVEYMTAFYVGDGLNALLPAFIGLAQGVGVRSECLNDSRPHLTPAAIAPDAAPRFGIGTFFVCLAVLCCASTAAFALLNNLSVCRRQLLARESPEVTPEITLLHADSNSGRVEVVTAVYVDRGTLSGADDLWEVAALLAIALWVNGLTNGLLNSSQPYASMPYGVETYAWALRLSYIAKPALCFFVLYQRALCSLAAVAFWTLVGSAVAAYQIYLAVKSPHPPLQDQIGGKILVVACFIGVAAVFIYVKLGVSCRLRQKRNYPKALLWYGVAKQTGSFLGAISSVIVINVLGLLHSAPPCE